MFAKRLVVVFLLIGACERSSANGVPTATFHGPDGTATAISLELATSEIARERGLMFRKELAPSAGMLFIFPDEAPRSFWMKNTYIPLDMIFLSGNREVVGVIPRAEPMTLAPRSIAAKAKYVLEVNGGFAAAHGIVVGARMDLVDVP